ncbi:hypothetical protein FALBO_1041 [Fusarium albosuccineum]|uniref:Uncharacterized protein n=1 Tax=Fusarium albosuccineum TaxID=1237068 RepID=A0A8H4LLZ3_9HYPO|nr:hypothetical protein FALBO_1041 [Fusarium albosuccineum]
MHRRQKRLGPNCGTMVAASASASTCVSSTQATQLRYYCARLRLCLFLFSIGTFIRFAAHAESTDHDDFAVRDSHKARGHGRWTQLRRPNCGTSAPALAPLPVLGSSSIITSTFDKPYQEREASWRHYQICQTQFFRECLVHDLCPTSTSISSACDPASTTKNTVNLNFDTTASDSTFKGHHKRW